MKQYAAFHQTEVHRGLTNNAGENNCFLNVTIQALWHLGPFRVHLKRVISLLEQFRGKTSESPNKQMLIALCDLFIKYEFSELDVLPPNELRECLAKLSEDFDLGRIADATETLDTILQTIHHEFQQSCPGKSKCLAHATFGGVVLEQTICSTCGASSEPTVRSDFFNFYQSAEILHYMDCLKPPLPLISLETSHKTSSFFNLSFLRRNRTEITPDGRKIYRYSNKEMREITRKQLIHSRQFGLILRKCMTSLGKRSCPSLEDTETVTDGSNLSSQRSLTSREGKQSGRPCPGLASVQFYPLEAPLVLALSIGWTDSKETGTNLLKFFSAISNLIYWQDLFKSEPSLRRKSSRQLIGRSSHSHSSKEIDPNDQDMTLDLSHREAPPGPAYVFRGLVCYYGKHYVSIFLDTSHEAEENYLLFDDHRIRPIGNWQEVVKFCVSCCYQPVLLLYELERQSSQLFRDQVPEELLEEDSFINSKERLYEADSKEGLSSSKDYTSKEKSNSSSEDCSDGNGSMQIISMDENDFSQVRAVLLESDEKASLFSDSSQLKGAKEGSIDDISFLSVNENRNVLSNYLSFSKEQEGLLEKYTEGDRSGKFWKMYYEARYGPVPELPELTLDGKEQRNDNDLKPFTPEKLHKYQIQSIITQWGRKPFRYRVSLPTETKDSVPTRANLGIILDSNEKDEVFVIDFYRHPVTHISLAAEASGKIQLMDQLLAINGELVSGLQGGNHNILLQVQKLINTLQEPYVLFELQSSTRTSLWYQCPQCSFINDILPEREESLKKQLVKRIRNRKIRAQDDSNIHSVQNYGIYFMCKCCRTRSFCKEYLPDLSN